MTGVSWNLTFNDNPDRSRMLIDACESEDSGWAQVIRSAWSVYINR